MGPSLTIPIQHGRLALGTWQGDACSAASLPLVLVCSLHPYQEVLQLLTRRSVRAGVYLNEHRNYGGPRQVVVTLQGQKRRDGRKYGSGR